jgi:ribokinase
VTGQVCVVGSLNYDLVARVLHLPRPGETVRGTDFEMHLGGKGLNQAIAARRGGAAVTMVGCVGDDEFGRQILACLSREGIDHADVATVAGATGVAIPLVEEDSGENAIVVVAGANAAMTDARVVRAEAAICAASVLVLQLEIPMTGVLEAARLGHAAGAQIVLNPAPAAPLPDELGELTDVLVVNETELTALGGDPAAGDLVEVARDLHVRWGLRAVVVTLGARGVLVVTDHEHFRLAPHQVDVIDTVAAGDAFCGALAAALAAGHDLRQAAVRGNAAGALACTVRGAEPSLPRGPAIDALLREA